MYLNKNNKILKVILKIQVLKKMKNNGYSDDNNTTNKNQ
jgi:hypothetical protein